MATSTRGKVLCNKCKKFKTHVGHGLCGKCYYELQGMAICKICKKRKRKRPGNTGVCQNCYHKFMKPLIKCAECNRIRPPSKKGMCNRCQQQVYQGKGIRKNPPNETWLIYDCVEQELTTIVATIGYSRLRTAIANLAKLPKLPKPIRMKLEALAREVAIHVDGFERLQNIIDVLDH